MSKKIVIDSDLCVGCKACVDNYPEFFGWEEKGNHSKVIAAYDEAKKKEIQEAIDNCPGGAIKIEDEEADKSDQ